MKTILIIVLCLSSLGCNYPVTPPHTIIIDTGIYSGAKFLWKIPRYGNNDVHIQPIRDGNSLFFVDQHWIRCIDINTGALLWKSDSSEIGGSSAENMLMSDGTLIVVDGYQIVCVSTTDGKKVWAIPPPPGISSFHEVYFNDFSQSPNVLYVTSWDTGELFAISKTSGTIIWRTRGALLDSTAYTTRGKGGNWNGCPVYSNGRIYVPSRYGASLFWKSGLDHDGSIACFDATSGVLQWNKLLPPMANNYSPYATNSASTTEFFTNIAQGNILAINDTLLVKTGNALTWLDREGNILWRSGDPDKHGLSESPYQLRFSQSCAMALDYKGGMTQCYGIDQQKHSYLWKTVLSENSSDFHSFVISPPPVLVGNIIYFLSDDFWIFGVNVLSGTLTYTLNLYNTVQSVNRYSQVMDDGFYVDDEHRIFIMDNEYMYSFQMTQ